LQQVLRSTSMPSPVGGWTGKKPMTSTTARQSPVLKARVLVVDDHPIVRQGLSELIGQEADLEVSEAVENAAEALKTLQHRLPDVAIVDLSLKDGNNGLDLIKDIKSRWPSLPMLVLSMHDETVYAERCLRAGARGYVMKGEPGDVVMDAVRRVRAGRVWLSEKMAGRLLDKLADSDLSMRRATVESLSDRELEVFRLLGEGFGTRAIGEKLQLSTKTIETYREHIKTKLGLESAGELLQYAIRWAHTNPVE
jgi:DNA-binding NarL/FixJ family response regulator